VHHQCDVLIAYYMIEWKTLFHPSCISKSSLAYEDGQRATFSKKVNLRSVHPE
jgi:hypothetical protein